MDFMTQEQYRLNMNQLNVIVYLIIESGKWSIPA